MLLLSTKPHRRHRHGRCPRRCPTHSRDHMMVGTHGTRRGSARCPPTTPRTSHPRKTRRTAGQPSPRQDGAEVRQWLDKRGHRLGRLAGLADAYIAEGAGDTVLAEVKSTGLRLPQAKAYGVSRAAGRVLPWRVPSRRPGYGHRWLCCCRWVCAVVFCWVSARRSVLLHDGDRVRCGRGRPT